MGDNGEKDMLDALERAFDGDEPLPKKGSDLLFMGGLKLIYGVAKEGRNRSRANAIQIKLQWGMLGLLSGAVGLKFVGLF
jgi:hypothetical protein